MGLFSNSKSSNNSNGGKTAGIVIGSLIGCCVAVFAVYYVMQNGNPLFPQQQSFGNLNNDANTDGVVDGVSNPMAAGSDNDSNNGDSFAMDTKLDISPKTEPSSGSFDLAAISPEPEASPAPTGLEDIFGNAPTVAPVNTGPAVTVDVPSDSLI